MVRKKNKEKMESNSPKNLLDHSDSITKASKNPTTENNKTEEIKQWVSQLARSPDVIKALQQMAQAEPSGVISQSTIKSETEASSSQKTLSQPIYKNPEMEITPKTPSQNFPVNFPYKKAQWINKSFSNVEMIIETGFNHPDPWQIIKESYPPNWFLEPKDLTKTQEYYANILEETGSVKIKHNFDRNGQTIMYSSIQVRRIIHPSDWSKSLYNPVPFKTLKHHYPTFSYFDYVKAWEKVFSIQNSNYTHSWLVYFDVNINTSKIPYWFINWWHHHGNSDQILSEETLLAYQTYKINYNPNQYEKQFPSLLFFCMNFFIPWVYQWYYEISTVPGTAIPAILKKHKIKWWTSFKNSTTETTVRQ